MREGHNADASCMPFAEERAEYPRPPLADPRARSLYTPCLLKRVEPGTTSISIVFRAVISAVEAGVMIISIGIPEVVVIM